MTLHKTPSLAKSEGSPSAADGARREARRYRCLVLIAPLAAAAALIRPCVAAAAPPKPHTAAAIVAIIHHRFDAVGEGSHAVCVATGESHLHPGDDNDGQDGLFQINRGTWDPHLNPAALPIVGPIDWSRIFEPAYNAMVAFRIWKHSGWLPAWNADARSCHLWS